MLNAIFRPLEKWPGEPTIGRKHSPFQSRYAATLDLLETELRHLHATNVVIQAQCHRDQIRNDGWLKSDAAVQGAAVIVSFTGVDEVEYSYPCDTFLDWRDNIRAIALALEALRKVDRYGVTKRGEQYHGFRALPPPSGPAKKMTPDEAAAVLAATVPGVEVNAILADRQFFEAMLKFAQKKLHPDISSGSHEEFVKLQEAAAALIEYFEERKKAAGGAR